MRRRRVWWPAAIARALLGLLLALPPVAHARKLQMSGSWEMRRGQVFLPLQFLWVPPPPSILTAIGPSFPNGPVLGQGGVTATATAPETLRVPRHRFGGEFTAKVALAGPTLVQITTRITPDGPSATATLAPGGGPGSFTWCPGDPDVGGGGGMLSTDPPQGAGPRNGRVIYRAVANRFGGVMQMLLSGQSVNSFVFETSPAFLVGHTFFWYEAGLQHTGGPYAFTGMHYDPRGIVTIPLVPPTDNGLVAQPRPQCCGGTASPFSPCCLPAVTPTPMGFQAAQAISETGFSFTTGTLFVRQTTGSAGETFVTVMGSDLRTALGAGNITLVAGGLSFRRRVGSSVSYASVDRVWTTLSAPIPSLTPVGLAAASALLLLAAGYALRGRAGR